MDLPSPDVDMHYDRSPRFNEACLQRIVQIYSFQVVALCPLVSWGGPGDFIFLRLVYHPVLYEERRDAIFQRPALCLQPYPDDLGLSLCHRDSCQGNHEQELRS